MITPEHSDPAHEPRRRRLGPWTIALVGVIGAGLTLMVLTSPDPEELAAAPPSSTSTTTTTSPEIEPLIDLENFSVDQISRGEPFAWESTLSVVEGYPTALLSHRDVVYLFATDRPNFSGFEIGGLRAWRSSDGLTWESLGEVIPGSSNIWPIKTTDQGLLALETNSDGGVFTLWHSEDGTNWVPDEVEDFNPLITLYPHAIGGNDALVVVAGSIQVDAQPIFEDKLGEIAAYQWEAIVMSEEVQFNLYGPLGRLTQVSGTDLGLTEEERQMFIDANSATSDVAADVWVKAGAGDWQRTTIDDAQWIDSFATTPDGDLVAHGWGPSNSRSWVTSDGRVWSELPSSTERYLETSWEDQFVAAAPPGWVTLLVSADGQDWEEIGPAEHFPDEIDWWLNGLAAGPGGVAVSVTGSIRNQDPWPTGLVESPSITSEDGVLTIDFDIGEYRLDTGEDTHVWSGATTHGIDVDLERGTVRFSDFETDEPLAEFPLEEILNSQNEVIYAEPADLERYNAFAFTSDGEDWTIQSLDDLKDHYINLLAVTDTHVVVTGVPSAGYFNPSAPPGLEVWTAAIP